jgi:diguanylate cyclase (GGDEF)-like protein
MVAAPIPQDEQARIETLEAYQILDTMPEQVFDDITYLASEICHTPIALISLVDTDRQWFKSRVGLEATETHRDVAFCAHAILEPDALLEVRDAEEDPRFADNELVLDGLVRFYAGAPLQAGKGSAIGTICVIDREPRELDDDQRAALAALSRQVMGQLELRKSLRDLRAYQARLERYQQQLEKANEKLSAQRHTDGLTGVANRSAFDQRLDEETHRLGRYGGTLSLLMIDIDHFKKYNDSFGHAVGDEVLKKVARVLADIGRTSDFVARFGGEEFAVILPETELAGAAILAERFRRGVEDAAWEHGGVTVSIGLAEFDEGDSAHDLMKNADAALYAAKAAGRNRVVEAQSRD